MPARAKAQMGEMRRDRLTDVKRSLLAVRTGLEPVTPCVTGMYSNQAELTHLSLIRVQR